MLQFSDIHRHKEMKHSTVQVLVKEHALDNLVLGLANPYLFLLMSKFLSKWDTQDKTAGRHCQQPAEKSLSLFYKEGCRGSERFRNLLGSHRQELDLGPSHCS